MASSFWACSHCFTFYALDERAAGGWRAACGKHAVSHVGLPSAGGSSGGCGRKHFIDKGDPAAEILDMWRGQTPIVIVAAFAVGEESWAGTAAFIWFFTLPVLPQSRKCRKRSAFNDRRICNSGSA